MQCFDRSDWISEVRFGFHFFLVTKDRQLRRLDAFQVFRDLRVFRVIVLTDQNRVSVILNAVRVSHSAMVGTSGSASDLNGCGWGLDFA